MHFPAVVCADDTEPVVEAPPDRVELGLESLSTLRDVDLADHRGGIAGVLEHFRQQDLLLVNVREDVLLVAVLCNADGIASGEEGRSRGPAYGLGVEIRELHALGGHAVDAGRPEVGRPEDTEVAIALVIGEHDDEVGRPLRLFGRGRAPGEAHRETQGYEDRLRSLQCWRLHMRVSVARGSRTRRSSAGPIIDTGSPVRRASGGTIPLQWSEPSALTGGGPPGPKIGAEEVIPLRTPAAPGLKHLDVQGSRQGLPSGDTESTGPGREGNSQPTSAGWVAGPAQEHPRRLEK